MRDDFVRGLLKLRAMEVDIVLGSHPDQTRMLEKVEQISGSFNSFVDDSAWKKLMDARIEMVMRLIEGTR
jgi:hypothetical protein